MADNRTEQFAASLNELEAGGDLEQFLDLFATDAELSRPEKREHVQGAAAAEEFWQDYLGAFEQIHSDFSRVTDTDIGVLEWVGTGSLANGSSVSYAGVSILDYDDSGKIIRFTSYYDTQAFTRHTAIG